MGGSSLCSSGWQRTVHARACGRGSAGRDPVGREDRHGALGAHGFAISLVAAEEQQEGHIAVLLEEMEKQLVHDATVAPLDCAQEHTDG